MRLKVPLSKVLSLAAAVLFAAATIGAGMPARCLVASHCDRCGEDVVALSSGSCDMVAPASPLASASEPARDGAPLVATPAVSAVVVFAPLRPAATPLGFGRLSDADPPGGASPLVLRI